MLSIGLLYFDYGEKIKGVFSSPALTEIMRPTVSSLNEEGSSF